MQRFSLWAWLLSVARLVVVGGLVPLLLIVVAVKTLPDTVVLGTELRGFVGITAVIVYFVLCRRWMMRTWRGIREVVPTARARYRR